MAGGRTTNRLTDRGVRAFITAAAKKEAATSKLFDGGGLYFTLTPRGTPVWRVKYRLNGKERVFAVGTYPAVTLEQARQQRELIHAQLRAGEDPMRARRSRRAAAAYGAGTQTFRDVSEQWLALRQKDWSGVHYSTSRRAIERDLWPTLGNRAIGEITSAMIALPIEAIAARGALDTASKVLWHCICVFRLAQARGYCDGNPAEPVREVLPRRRAMGRRAALLDVDALRDLLRRADVAPISPSVRMAQRLCAFTASRVGTIVEAEWSEFDVDAQLPSWTIPRRKLKVKDRHFDLRILLGPSITAELRSWRDATEGKGYLFPSPTGAPFITGEAVEKAYRVTLGMAKTHSLHGWRASFSTLARDAGFSKEAVHLALDHVHASDVARAYDRGERLQERQRLAQWWDAQLTGREL